MEANRHADSQKSVESNGKTVDFSRISQEKTIINFKKMISP
jgi:hypothetical protein